LGDPLKGNLLLLYKPLHLEAQQVSTRIEVRRHQCSGEERIWNEATTVYADILEQASQIGKVEFTHCGRDLNSVAHELARFCFSSGNSCIWVDEPPSFILDKLLNDVTIL
jgi:hypothetical protein